jgi:hypothetical protein
VNLARDLAIIAYQPTTSCRRAGGSRANLLLGGAPATTAATGAIPGAEAPPEVTAIAVAELPNRLPGASFPWFIYTAVSMQNRFLSLPRSCRKKPFSVWWSME